ncbi:MAG: hypothetical protein M3Q24_01340 [bacterium]|nr:hypothetical protein [bacterium]
MNLQKVLLILGVIAALVAGYVIYNKNPEITTSNKEPEIKIDNTTKRPDLSNATFTFDNERVTLKNGEDNSPLSDNPNISQTTTLTDKVAYGDLNGDQKEDAVALLVQSGAGTGIFVYIGAYVSGSVRYSGSNTIFVGDRIIPQSIDIDKNIITVNYLDREEDEPLAATPTKSVIKTYVYIGGELKSIE